MRWCVIKSLLGNHQLLSVSPRVELQLSTPQRVLGRNNLALPSDRSLDEIYNTAIKAAKKAAKKTTCPFKNSNDCPPRRHVLTA